MRIECTQKNKKTGRIDNVGFLEIKNQSEEKAELYIYGDIVRDEWYNWSDDDTCPQDVTLSRCGFLVEQAIMSIPRHYPALSVDRYVVMPDHVHLLLRINSDDNGRRTFAPTISTVIQQMKGTVTKKAGFSVWQKGFHDHIVRGEQDYQEIWKYIESNPVKWADDHVWEETP